MVGNLDFILKVFQNHWKILSRKVIRSYLHFSKYLFGCMRENELNVNNAGIQPAVESCSSNLGKRWSNLELRKDVKKWQRTEILRWHRTSHLLLRKQMGESHMVSSLCLNTSLDGVLSLTMIEILDEEQIWCETW